MCASRTGWGVGRATRKLRIVIGESISLKVFGILLGFVFAMSWLFYLVERGPGTAHYTSYPEALEDILILAFSGYDVTKRPVTVVGYVAALSVLVAGIAFVTMLMGDTAALLVRRALRRDKESRIMKLSNHVLVCNWNEHGGPIVDELLADEASRSRDIVIVADLEEHPYPQSGVEFISGSPTRDDVLNRACVQTAATAIVLGDGGDATTSDSLAIMTALAVEAEQPKVYTCVLVFDCHNKQHLRHAHVDEIVCTTEMTDRILAQSALNHGLTSLVSQLLDFGEGSEIYKVRMPAEMAGVKAMDAARAMLDRYEALLIGIETGDGDGRRKVLTTTAFDGPIRAGDCAFVVADSLPSGLRCDS